MKPVLNLICYVSLCEGLCAGAGSLSNIVYMDCSFFVYNKEYYIFYYLIIIFVSGKVPSEVDIEFLQIASRLETYGLDPNLVTVSFSNLHNICRSRHQSSHDSVRLTVYI